MTGSVRERAVRVYALLRVSRLWRTFAHFSNAGGNVLAAGLSYQALFAVFAALWLGSGILVAVAGKNPALFGAVAEILNAQVPGLIAVGGGDGAITQKALLTSRALNWGSALAAVLLLWAAGSWFTAARRALRLSYGLPAAERGSQLLLKLRDLGLVLLFFVLVVLGALLTVLGSSAMGSVHSWTASNFGGWFASGAGMLLRLGIMVSADMAALLVLIRLLADVRVPWLPLLRGCLLGALVLTLLKTLGGAVLGGGSSNPLLAGFAVLVGLLVWFNLLCRTLLFTVSWLATGQDKMLGRPTAA